MRIFKSVMRNLIPNIIQYTTFAIFVVTLWILLPDELDTGMVREQGYSAVPEYMMKNFRYVSVEGEVPQMEMFSDVAYFYIKRQRILGENVTNYFFNAQGERTRVIGDKSIFNMETQVLNLKGNVESLSHDGFLMKSEEADYNVATSFLSTPTPVYGITQDEGMQIWGDRAESNLNENIVKFFGNARGTHDGTMQGMTKIRGDTATLYRDEKRVFFESNVKGNQRDIDLSSEEATLFYGEASGDPGSGVRYLIARRNVRIKEENERFSRSQVAEFFSDTNSIVLTELPSIYDGRDTITGEKLTLFRSTGVIEVMDANAAFQEEPDDGTKKKDQKVLTGVDLELVVEEKK